MTPSAASRPQTAVEATAGAEDGDPERADELERHGDPERQPVERLVEAEVHPGQGDREDDDVTAQFEPRSRLSPARAKRARAPAAKADRRKHGAARPDLVEERRRQRGPALDGDDPDHAPGRRRTDAGRSGWGRGRPSRHDCRPMSMLLAPDKFKGTMTAAEVAAAMAAGAGEGADVCPRRRRRRRNGSDPARGGGRRVAQRSRARRARPADRGALRAARRRQRRGGGGRGLGHGAARPGRARPDRGQLSRDRRADRGGDRRGGRARACRLRRQRHRRRRPRRARALRPRGRTRHRLPLRHGDRLRGRPCLRTAEGRGPERDGRSWQSGSRGCAASCRTIPAGFPTRAPPAVSPAASGRTAPGSSPAPATSSRRWASTSASAGRTWSSRARARSTRRRCQARRLARWRCGRSGPVSPVTPSSAATISGARPPIAVRVGRGGGRRSGDHRRRAWNRRFLSGAESFALQMCHMVRSPG